MTYGVDVVGPGAAVPDDISIDPGIAGSDPAGRPRSRIGPALRRALGFLPIMWLTLVVAAAVLAPWLPIDDPEAIAVQDKLMSPGGKYVLGSDGVGHDILSRLIFGARTSLVIAVGGVLLAAFFGGLLGLIAGFFGGLIDRILVGVADVMLSFPPLVLLIGVLSFAGPSLGTLTIVIGVLAIPRYLRVVRASTLTIVGREFVQAARFLGARRRDLLMREVLPNVAPSLITYAVLNVSVIVILEGGLAFLGLSVPPPAPTWGGMIAEGKRHLAEVPHVSVIPAVVMLFTVLSANFLGDRLRTRLVDIRPEAI